MCVVCLHIQTHAQNGHAPIVMLTGVVDQARRHSSGVMPKQLAGLCIQRIGVVGAGHEHDARNHHRSDFKWADRAGVEHPLRGEPACVRRSYLSHRAVTRTGVVTVVRDPVVSKCRDKE